MPPVVELQGVTRRFADTVAVDGLDLTVREGQFVALLGPSGCGKTTTLRMIAGYVEPSVGRILLVGTDATKLPAERRNIGMVFQNYALFPHLTVEKNVAFGLQMRKLGRDEIRTRVREALDLVGLVGLARRRPAELSGGQQQRVALARAVAIRPAVLLLDEPLSNLDEQLRAQMRRELRRIQRETGLTAILVTHDQQEALELADEIVIMDGGRMIQRGHPKDVFRAPATRFVARFLGYENFFTLPGKGLVTIRPEHVVVANADAGIPQDCEVLTGTVTDVRFRGTDYAVTVQTEDSEVLATSTDETVTTAMPVRLLIPLAQVIAVHDGHPGLAEE
jgi:putative spermidine/putrescine transport system ATP-binding protein